MWVTSDICEGLHLLLGIVAILLTSVIVSGTVLMHAWIIKNRSWSMYANTLDGVICIAVLVMARTLVIWFSWSLRRSRICAHSVWKFTLSLGDNLQWFLLLDVELTFLTVGSHTCYMTYAWRTCTASKSPCTIFVQYILIGGKNLISTMTISNEVLWLCHLLGVRMVLCTDLLWSKLVKVFINETIVVEWLVTAVSPFTSFSLAIFNIFVTRIWTHVIVLLLQIEILSNSLCYHILKSSAELFSWADVVMHLRRFHGNL